jgi:predicted XRE-type DNA-binding protein
MKDVTKGSGNVFADLGLPQAEDLQTRAQLTHQIYSLIKERGLKQKDAAELLGIKQPDVSALMNGRFADFSVDRLLHFLVRLNQNVEIIIRPASTTKGKHKAAIRVSASHA